MYFAVEYFNSGWCFWYVYVSGILNLTVAKVLPWKRANHTILSGADKLEHGIDYNDSEDDFEDHEHNELQGGEDGTDSYKDYIACDASARGYNTERKQILSIQNLPGCVNYGLEDDTSSLSKETIKMEVGIQVDLDRQWLILSLMYMLQQPVSVCLWFLSK